MELENIQISTDDKLFGKNIYSGENSTRLRVAVYARVSTQEQAQKNVSVPQQLQDCVKLIKEKAWIFIKEYRDDGISGHLIAERPGLQSMLQDARQHEFDLILVKDYDRFARNKDAIAVIRQELKDLGIQVYAINTPVEPRPVNLYDPNEDDSTTIMEAISDMRADLERKAINRRMKAGRLSRATSGKIPNRVPYGYNVIRTLENNKIKRNVVINEKDADKIRYIFDEYVHGCGHRKIAISMNKKGWQAPLGGAWTTQTIRYILSNVTYTGKVCWGWRHALYNKTKEWQRRGKLGYTGKGDHLPIVNETLAKLANEVRIARSKQAKGAASRSFGLLTGIAKCIRCRNGVGYQKRHHNRSNQNPGWNDTITYEYICTGYKYKGVCSQRVMSAIKLETAVLDHIKNIYSNTQVQEKIVYADRSVEESNFAKKIELIDNEITAAAEKERRHKEAYERGLETLEELENYISKIRSDVRKNHVEKDKYIELSSLTSQKKTTLQALVVALKDFDTFWSKAELDEKKMILRSIIKEIRAGDGRVEIDFIF